jgi:hypothetical protein
MCRIGSDAVKDELEGQRSCRGGHLRRECRENECNAVNAALTGPFARDFRCGRPAASSRCYGVSNRVVGAGWENLSRNGTGCFNLAEVENGDLRLVRKQKAARRRPSSSARRRRLTDRRAFGAGHDDRLACLHDMRRLGRLGEVRAVARGNPETHHRDAGHEGYGNDLQMGRPIR